MSVPSELSPKPAVSVALFRGSDVLLIKRGKPPYLGVWSLPGGSLSWGEEVEAAARRELLEETGLTTGPLYLCTVFNGIRKNEAGETMSHFVISVFTGRHAGGDPLASSDALEASWHSLGELGGLTLTPGLMQVIEKASLTLQQFGA
jgi:8-oxo-dGTP diphosphatase